MPQTKDTILLVDPTDSVQRMLIPLAHRLGAHLTTAADAAAAGRLFDRVQPVVAIVDMEMENGAALFDRIRTGRSETFIAVMAGADVLPNLMAELKDRADAFIRKPILPIELEIALLRARKLSAAARQHQMQTADAMARVRRQADAIVEKERFHFIKQIAGNLSTFMGRVASDAQDGLRYFDEMPYFMAIHSSQRKVLAANPAYTQHLGDRIAHDSWEIYADRWASPDGCPVGRTLNNGTVTTTRAAVRYLSGATVPVIVHTAPIREKSGRIDLVLEVFAGTKEIESMARQIRNTQQRYRQLFDAVPNYIAVLDRQMRLTAFNRPFLDDFGFKTGRKFFDVFKLSDRSADKTPIGRTLADGMPHQAEMVLFSPEGDQLNLMAWTSPITTAAGKLIQVLVIFTDVTKMRQMQDNLSQLGLMISTITHSLKGSLTGLDAGLYMIEKGFYRNRPGRIEEGLDVAKLMTERIGKIVRDILYYAKERELETETVDAERFAADVVAGIRTKIAAANIRLDFSADTDAGTIEIDTSMVRASLINILENAMEACIADTSDTAHRIEFAVRGSPDHVLFRIADNGVGMDEDQLQNIFKLFWSSKGKKGTGLGLFITNKVIRKHGGTITVASEPDRYTAFQVRLPRAVAS